VPATRSTGPTCVTHAEAAALRRKISGGKRTTISTSRQCRKLPNMLEWASAPCRA
jgi:hypothetical protein